MINEKGLSFISKQMESIKISFEKKVPIVSESNMEEMRIKVVYSDGKVVENKYKKLETDILSDRCKIITI